MDIHEKSVTAIRMLAADAIQKANSGHPGLPLGAASIGYNLFDEHLVFSPGNPRFFNRDRFVLSAGHGTMLLYGLLHLFGYNVSMEDIKNFRQTDSITTGHPEISTPGVDCSTGPLGQGIANAVGIAAAETIMAAKFNREGFDVCDHYTYALCGEGCLMEGIEYEAASLAGTWQLGKLIVLYDCNKITIEGDSDQAFDEDVAARHEAQGWQIIRVADGNSLWEISEAIRRAKAEKTKPSLVIINTKIGFGSPKEGSASCHGAPLGAENIEIMRKNFGWEYPPFTVPEEVYAHCAKAGERGAAKENAWKEMMKRYAESYPELYAEFNASLENAKKLDWEKIYSEKGFDGKMATRKASGIVLNDIAAQCPSFMGGSADLGPSNLTLLGGLGDYGKADRTGRNIHFGIREHAMAAICNGLALHGGIRPYCATFFSFSDYMKNAVRMSAIMGLPVTYVFTHDSIGVGEDGPTHQPIEHLAGLRAMPVLKVFRPCDARETVAAYEYSLGTGNPTAIVASRQDLPAIEGTGKAALKGGYVIHDAPDFSAIIIAAGSEVSLAVDAAKKLAEEGIAVRVVSMPCMELFDEQSEEYKNSVLPHGVRARTAVEAGASLSWGKYVGIDGEYVCMDEFGISGKPADLFARYGFTVDNVVAKVKKTL